VHLLRRLVATDERSLGLDAAFGNAGHLNRLARRAEFIEGPSAPVFPEVEQQSQFFDKLEVRRTDAIEAARQHQQLSAIALVIALILGDPVAGLVSTRTEAGRTVANHDLPPRIGERAFDGLRGKQC
jgi:hypothetical protein